MSSTSPHAELRHLARLRSSSLTSMQSAMEDISTHYYRHLSAARLSFSKFMAYSKTINLLYCCGSRDNDLGVPSTYEQSRLDLRHDAPGRRTVARLQHDRTREAAHGGETGRTRGGHPRGRVPDRLTRRFR